MLRHINGDRLNGIIVEQGFFAGQLKATIGGQGFFDPGNGPTNGTFRTIKIEGDMFHRTIFSVVLQGDEELVADRQRRRLTADLIRKKWGVQYSSSNVRRIMPSLHLSCQKPDVEAAEHSSEAVEQWRKHDWLRIKKKRTKTVTS